MILYHFQHRETKKIIPIEDTSLMNAYARVGSNFVLFSITKI